MVREGEVTVEIEILKRWCEVSRTLIGKPDEGWVEQGEERWGEAMGLLESGMRGMDGWVGSENGEVGMYEMLVNVFIAEK